MKISRAFHKLSLWAAVGVLVLVSACSTDSPSEPSSSPAVPPGSGGGGGGGSYNVTVTTDPAQVSVGASDPVLVTVRATQPGGAPAPNGTLAQVTTLLGTFQLSDGTTAQTVTVELTNGTATLRYFPPASVDDTTTSTTITATVAGSVGRATIRFNEEDVLFIGSVDPSTGSPQGGEVVTIRGSGFEPPVRVSFGGVNAQVLSVNSNSIRVRTPASPGPANQVTQVPVSVTINVNQEGEASDTLNNAFTFAPGGDVQQPTVLSVTPATGPNEGGTRVTIRGSGFQAPVKVEFGNEGTGTFVEAEVESVAPDRLVVRTPAATGFGQELRNSSVTLRIQNLNSGLTTELEAAFRYGTEMIITALSPTQGPYFGGQIVTIFGQGFDGPVAVELAGYAQTPLTVTGTEITLRTSAILTDSCEDQEGPVEVVNIDNGEGATGPNYIYLVEAFTPIIFSVTPASGPEDGGTIITLNGENLSNLLGEVGGRPAEVVSEAGDGSSTSLRTPFLPLDEFNTEACDDNGDGTSGERYVPTSVDVSVTNRLITCSTTFTKGFTYIPDDQTCRNDVGPTEPTPVQCEDGFDNDSDGLIDAADPECTGPGDDDESA